MLEDMSERMLKDMSERMSERMLEDAVECVLRFTRLVLVGHTSQDK